MNIPFLPGGHGKEEFQADCCSRALESLIWELNPEGGGLDWGTTRLCLGPGTFDIFIKDLSEGGKPSSNPKWGGVANPVKECLFLCLYTQTHTLNPNPVPDLKTVSPWWQPHQ